MSHPRFHLSFALAFIPALLGAAGGAPEEPNRSGRSPTTRVPGVVISHLPQSTGVFIGSPSLARLPDGRLVASHDEFGPQSAEFVRAATRVFRSSDRGQTWTQVARIDGQFWSTLFAHRGALYLLGTDRHHGNVIIRRSRDGGTTWTSPTSAVTGLLRAQGEYHCAPVPVLEHAGRLWRAIERRDPPRGWGITYCAAMLSVPVGADLLDARRWTCSDFLPGDPKWLGGTFGGWLEGNAVVTREGALLDLLRVDTATGPEKAAWVNLSPDGKRASFSPETGFINFPGGAKKFTIRYDDRSARYWSVTSIAPGQPASATPPAAFRNTLALICSPDLKDWTVRTILLWHPDSATHGFQYVDWLFDGDDLVAACRTAFDDEAGGAHTYHDANFLTFHRWSHFRDLTRAGGRFPPPPDDLPQSPGRRPRRPRRLPGRRRHSPQSAGGSPRSSRNPSQPPGRFPYPLGRLPQSSGRFPNRPGRLLSHSGALLNGRGTFRNGWGNLRNRRGSSATAREPS